MTAFASLPLNDTPHASTRPLRELPRRTMHGGTGWTATVAVDAVRYQPQDQKALVSAAAEISPTTLLQGKRRLAEEPEDARITGGTRSLMRRLSGLNVRPLRPLLTPVPGLV